jgi:hypothetical protein
MSKIILYTADSNIATGIQRSHVRRNHDRSSPSLELACAQRHGVQQPQNKPTLVTLNGEDPMNKRALQITMTVPRRRFFYSLRPSTAKMYLSTAAASLICSLASCFMGSGAIM